MKRLAIVLGAASLLALHPTANAQDAAAGRSVFQQCAACHAVDATNGLGPGLVGIVGRKAGGVPGFRYSRALRGAGIVWNESNLDAYLADPQQLVPGNVMPFSGMADAAQRADLIAYLKTVR
jgi:cytochrome c